MKKQREGITLIALIITIIILLILAGVAISLTIGEHGILNMAKEAREEYQIASAQEKLELELEHIQTFTMPLLTSNDCIVDGKRYIVTASSNLNSGELNSYYIFDGVIGRASWHSKNANNQWIQIQFPDKVKINSFTIINRDYSPSYAVSDFELLVSNDSENWTSLGKYKNSTTKLAKTSFNVENSNFYYYYKFNCGNGYKSISEITIDDALVQVKIIDTKMF